MKISKYEQGVSAFLPHSIKRKALEEAFSGTETATSSTVAITETTQSFYGAVSVPSGVVLIPYSSGYIGLVSAAGVYSRGPQVAGSARFRGGCLLDDGRVVMAPTLSPNIGIYNPKTNQYTAGAATGLGTGSGPGFAGCCQAKNGMVVLAPLARATIGLYNPKTNVYIDGPAHGLSDTTFAGCVPLPNGKVLLIPYNGGNFGLYDPETNTYTNGPALSGGAKFYGGTVLSNGDVLCTNYSHDHICIYQWKTNTLFARTGLLNATTDLKFVGSCLTNDGRVVLAPYNYATVMVYDPVSDTITAGAAGSGESYCAGAAALPNGKIVIAPHTSTNILIVDPYNAVSQSVSDELRLNRYFNTGF